MFFNVVWWLVPIIIIVWWIPQNIQHELSHCLVIPKDFSWKPWFLPGWKLGYFTWAHYTCKGDRPLTEAETRLIAITPRASNLIVILVTFFISLIVSDSYARSVLFGLAVTNFIDLSYGTLSILSSEREHSDIWTYYKNSGLTLMSMRTQVIFWNMLCLLMLVLGIKF